MTDLGQGEAVVSWTPLGGTKRVCRFGVNCDIGRGPRNRILLADSAVSRQHAVLELDPGGLRVRVVSSSGEVRVNGARFGHLQASPLTVGDVLGVGAVEIRVDALRLPSPVTATTCVNPSCGRPVPVEQLDCPSCGWSRAPAR